MGPLDDCVSCLLPVNEVGITVLINFPFFLNNYF